MHNKGRRQAQGLAEILSIGSRPRESDPAGLLALGSSVADGLPSGVVPASGWLVAFSAPRLVSDVPDYSGGTAAEFHRVPGYWMSID
jgi:hypothetical protein